MIQKILWILHLDLAVLGYQLACALCGVGLVCRMLSWFRYPPNRRLWSRAAAAWAKLTTRERAVALLGGGVSRIAVQSYIARRGWLRWVTHFAIVSGVAAAGGGSLALIWGTLSFALVDQQTYRALLFEVPLLDFRVGTFEAFLIFNAINLGSLLLLGGLALAFWQRLTTRRSETLERPRAHFGALGLLLAVTVSGLLLAVSYKFLGGFGHGQLVYLHEISVVLGLLWLPFGKFFHLAVSPAAVALDVTERAGDLEPSRCSRCGKALSALWRPQDLQEVLSGSILRAAGDPAPAEASLCPSCRQRRQASFLLLGTGRASHPVAITFGDTER